MLAILYALITVLAWGTWLAPSQNIPLKDQQIRVFYVASANLLLAFIIGLFQGLGGLTGSVFWMPFAGGLVWAVSGLCAFTATARGTADSQGIFLVNPSLTIEQVVRSGTLVGGENLANPEFLDGPNLGGLTGLNQNGQLAFFADLGGNFAIFLWSHPQIQSVAQSGSDVLITVQTVGGTTNFVQATSDLTGGFSDIATVITPGGGLVTTNVLDAGAASNTARFYRVSQLP